MVRIWKLALVLCAALMMSACCSIAVEKKAVDDLQATHDLIFPEYIKLVEKEYAGKPDEIARRKRLVQSSNDLTGAMKKALEK